MIGAEGIEELGIVRLGGRMNAGDVAPKVRDGSTIVGELEVNTKALTTDRSGEGDLGENSADFNTDGGRKVAIKAVQQDGGGGSNRGVGIGRLALGEEGTALLDGVEVPEQRGGGWFTVGCDVGKVGGALEGEDDGVVRDITCTTLGRAGAGVVAVVVEKLGQEGHRGRLIGVDTMGGAAGIGGAVRTRQRDVVVPDGELREVEVET